MESAIQYVLEFSRPSGSARLKGLIENRRENFDMLGDSILRDREEHLVVLQRDLQDDLDALQDLQSQLRTLENTGTSKDDRNDSKRLVCLGGSPNFAYSQALVKRGEHGSVYVDVGAGFFVEFGIDEALKVIEKRIQTSENAVEAVMKKRAAMQVEWQIMEDSLRALRSAGIL